MKLLHKLIYLLLIALFVPISCVKESLSDLPTRSAGKTTVCVELDQGGSKSSLFGDDSRIEEARIVIYDAEGFLYEVLEVVEGKAQTELWCTESYWFYALANLPDVSIPTARADFLSIRYGIENIDSTYSCMPMVGAYGYAESESGEGTPYTVPSGGRPQYLTLSMVRLLSRVDVAVEFDDLEGLNITSMRLKQAATDIQLFAHSSQAQSVYDFDYASAADLEAINAGETISLYCFENAQGELRYGRYNSLNWRTQNKTVDFMQQHGLSNAELCTYIEVEAEFAPGADYEGKVIYRVLLGQNATYDLNLLRNNVVTLTFELSDEHFDNPLAWKMNTDELIIGEIQSRDTIYVAQSKTQTFSEITRNFSASLSESGRVYENDILRISNTGNVVTYEGIGAGSTAIYVKGRDADRNIYEYAVVVTVLAPELAFDTQEIRLSLTGTPQAFSQIAKYYKQDGTEYTDYEEDLYDELLALEYRLSGSIVEHLTLEDDQIYIHSVFDPNNSDHVALLSAVPVSAAAADSTVLTIRSYDPFPASMTLSDRLESYALCTGGTAEQDEKFQFGIGEFADFTDTSTYHFVLGTPDKLLSERATAWYENNQVNLLWHYASYGDAYIPSAAETLSGYLVNQWSGESWWSPSRWTVGFNVNVAVGGEVYFVGGSTTNPMSYSIRAAWGHKHDASSVLEQIGTNLVAADEDYHGYYATGIGTPLYSLDYGTGYPTDDSWYQNNTPRFSIVDVEADNHLNPTYVSVPYKVIEGEYNLIIWHYKTYFPNSNNWVGK